MPKVSIKKSDGVKFDALAMGVIFVFNDEAYVKTDYNRARSIEMDNIIPFDENNRVSIATKVHVEY